MDSFHFLRCGSAINGHVAKVYNSVLIYTHSNHLFPNNDRHCFSRIRQLIWFNPIKIPYILDHHHEISGSNARLTLIRMRSFLDSNNICNTLDPNTLRLRRLLTNLIHIQQLAYSHEQKRSTRNILAMHNLTYIFSLDYIKVSWKP